MRFRFTKSKGTMIFGIWLIFVGVNQLPFIQIVHKDYIGALIVITAGVFILFEF
jgi:FtsH-binding integral membrane protein